MQKKFKPIILKCYQERMSLRGLARVNPNEVTSPTRILHWIFNMESFNPSYTPSSTYSVLPFAEESSAIIKHRQFFVDTSALIAYHRVYYAKLKG
jgi:hypothetical protein